jgi:hypothetical protein
MRLLSDYFDLSLFWPSAPLSSSYIFDYPFVLVTFVTSWSKSK